MVDPKEFLRTWRRKNVSEFYEVHEHQKKQDGTDEGAGDGDLLVEPEAVETPSQQDKVPFWKRPFVKSQSLVVDDAAAEPSRK